MSYVKNKGYFTTLRNKSFSWGKYRYPLIYFCCKFLCCNLSSQFMCSKHFSGSEKLSSCYTIVLHSSLHHHHGRSHIGNWFTFILGNRHNIHPLSWILNHIQQWVHMFMTTNKISQILKNSLSFPLCWSDLILLWSI